MAGNYHYIPPLLREVARRVFIYEYPAGLKILAKRAQVDYYRLYNFCNIEQEEYIRIVEKMKVPYKYLTPVAIDKCLNECGYRLAYTIEPI